MKEKTKENEIERERRKRIEARKKKKKRRRRQQMLARGCVFAAAALIAFLAGRGIWNLRETRNTGYQNMQLTKYIADTPDYRVELLTINEYSRPGLAIDAVNGIVVHYTANPGTTAEQNRGYFEGLAESGETYSSSHFIIGLDGEIIQCIPCNEIAYASNERNSDTISIECCIPDETGEFSDATYDALVELVTWLMGRYDLDAEDVIRHYDVTGKNCPKYFVEHEAAWQQFHNDLLAYIDRYGIAKTEEIK